MSNDAEMTLVMKAKDLASRSVDGLRGSLGGLHGAATKASGGLKGAAGGILDVGKTAAFAATGGIIALVGALGFATKQAADEETGIARMDAALKANVKGWKGNTDAIEATIAQREKLAFSDDSLRASMTILVARFHDVGKATSLQSTAMDLARLKGVDLETASTMLGKALGGNKKVLKDLGIELPKTASQTQILAAIQKVSAGQAEAYGKTSKGAMEAFQIAAGDVVEDIGSAFLPVMTGAFKFLTNTGIPAIRGIIKTVTDWVTANQPLIKSVGGFLFGAISTVVSIVTRFVIPAIKAVIGAVKGWIDANQPLIHGVLAALSNAVRVVGGVLKVVIPIVLAVARVALPILGKAVGFLGQVIGTVFKGIGVVWNKAWQIARAVVNGIGSAWTALTGVVRTVWNGIIGIAKGAANFMIGIVNGIIRAIDSIQVHIGRIGLDTPFGWVGVGPFDWWGPQIRQIPYLAQGGIVRKPTLAMIGEAGPEAVVPLDRGGGFGGGGGQPVELVLKLDGRTIAKIVDEHLYYALQRAAPTRQRV